MLPFEDEQGQLSYRMEDCRVTPSPTVRSSIWVQALPSWGFVAEGAVVVVSDIEMLPPDPEAWSGQLYPLDPDEDMRWSYLQDRPESVTEQELFFMHVQDEEMRQLEVLACWPESEAGLPAHPQTLTMNGPEQRDYSYGMQVDGPGRPGVGHPSGQLSRVRAHHPVGHGRLPRLERGLSSTVTLRIPKTPRTMRTPRSREPRGPEGRLPKLRRRQRLLAGPSCLAASLRVGLAASLASLGVELGLRVGLAASLAGLLSCGRVLLGASTEAEMALVRISST